MLKFRISLLRFLKLEGKWVDCHDFIHEHWLHKDWELLYKTVVSMVEDGLIDCEKGKIKNTQYVYDYFHTRSGSNTIIPLMLKIGIKGEEKLAEIHNKRKRIVWGIVMLIIGAFIAQYGKTLYEKYQKQSPQQPENIHQP